MSVIGLDIGTTGCKAIVFGPDWEILGRAAREYSILTPHVDWAEQDAEQVWQLALDALAQAVNQANADPPRAMALSVQGEAVIPVDKAGRPLRHAILGMDTRSTVENAWLAQVFDPQVLFGRTGMPMHTINTITKLLWLKRNEPAVWASAAQFLLYEDYFLRRLTGKAVISHCLASRTQMYDLGTANWATDILDGCEIDPARLASIQPQRESVVGMLDRAVARRIGVSGDLLLVSGGHDQACAALGSGVIEPGAAMVSTGTAEVVEVAMTSPVLAESLRQGGISIYRHVVPGLYVAMTLNHSGGMALRWFRDTLCGGSRGSRPEGRGTREDLSSAVPQVPSELPPPAPHPPGPVPPRDAYDLILAEAPAGPTGLMVLPHFCGAGTPLVDVRSRAAILGLTLATTQAEIAKAILEGLTYELRTNLELLRDAGIRLDRLHAVGGGARSKMWLQMKADVCQIRLRLPRITEAACLGAAILAAAGARIHTDIAACVDHAVRFDETIGPELQRAGQYDRRYGLYKKLYPALSPLHREISSCSD
jgi:xylulokinase